MSLLFNVIYATKCTSTHHKIALDALGQIRGPAATQWHDLFLKHHAAYLTGAKAPDATFKDFKNHVLHVGEGYWGGAADEARRWYGRCVASLRAGDWPQAVYQAGVLSHYYADPLQPFHTGQTEEEGKLHRPVEWSITKSYEELRRMLVEELGGYPEFDAPDGGDWLETMVQQGAELSHPTYELLLDHYDLDAGIKQPPAGLDTALQNALARLIGHAVVGLARIFERAFAESRAQPPEVSLVLESLLATLNVPLAWVSKKLGDVRERAALAELYYEVQKTGKAIYTLPEDDWTVRQQHAEEVLKIARAELDAQPVRPTGLRHGRPAEKPEPASPRSPRIERPERPAAAEPELSVRHTPLSEPPPAPREPLAPRPPREEEPEERPTFQPFWSPAAEELPEPPAPSLPPSRDRPAYEPVEDAAPSSGEPRFFLELDSPIVDAPGIGSKTADRLEAVGLHRVIDLLRADPKSVAARINQRWITPEVVRQWQQQAELVRRIPELRGHDAQILATAGLTDPEDIATLRPERVLDRIAPVVQSQEGQRILRSARPPDLEEVTQWVAWAAEARAAFQLK